MPNLVRNSTWKILDGVENIRPGEYRILEVCAPLDMLIIFKLEHNKKLCRPFSINLKLFEKHISRKLIVKFEYETPNVMTLGEKGLPPSWKARRDDKYKLIEPLVEDKSFLKRLVEKKRTKIIKNRASNLKIKEIYIYRALNEYWEYGQTLNALLPKFEQSGAPGEEKTTDKDQRGKPKKQPVYGFSERGGVAVTEEHKKQMRNVFDEFYKKRKIKVVTKLYRKFLNKFYKNEIRKAVIDKKSPKVISIAQFRYWFKMLFDIVADEKETIGDVKWDMNKRALLSGVSELVSGPGDCYEIDSTVADIYVVSKFNRSWVIGRPVIYVVVDRASRIVAGLFVDILYASWDAAKQALLNAFLPKKEFCARYGVVIDEEEWPCNGLPLSIECDRGEMIANAPEYHIAPMGIKLDFAAPTRADWKAVVERRFGIANKEALHDLDGTTLGKPKSRMDPDERKKAIHTLDEVTKILIQDFIEFHKTRNIEEILTGGMVSADLEPTPLNFWNYHVSRHIHSLSIIDEEQARAELMPAAKASITGRGIKLGDMYYSCEIAENENWFELARAEGEYSVDARIDDGSSNTIYVRKDKRSPLVRCNLLPRHRLYAELHRADVIWLSEWKREKKETGSDLLGRVNQEGNVEILRENAKEIRKNTVGSFKQVPNNVTNIREANRREKELLLEESYADDNKNIITEISENERKLRSKLAFIEQVLGNDD